MKRVVVIGDGMSDHPLDELEGLTPLKCAEIPNIDSIAKNGLCGMLQTVPIGMEAGSDVANLSIMGYNPKKYYTGRGPLEAASIGAVLQKDDVAFRCNFITQEEGILTDFNAGHISTAEASELIETLNQAFFSYGKFYLGTSYRHLFVISNENAATLKSTPPHDVVGEPISEHLLLPPKDELAIKINELMNKSREVLFDHPVNLKRMESNKKPANMIWLWGQGIKPLMTPFIEKYGLKAATITGVDLIKGIGTYLGLTNVKVPGATGFYDTDYCGKARYALKSLEDHDLVFIHVEAPDEAGHAGDIHEKIRAIERIDNRIVGKLLDELPSINDYAISILPDHSTPIDVRTHTSEPVPFAIYSPRRKSDQTVSYDELSVKKGSHGLMEGYKFLKFFIDYASD
jgi:2,3-bisphosphoglycerate-independent phosphoglycerate mutase